VNLPLQDSRLDGRERCSASGAAFASDQGWFRGRLELLNTAEPPVVRKIGNGDRPLSAARPATRRRLGGDPDNQLDDGTGLAVAAQLILHRARRPVPKRLFGACVARCLPLTEVYKD